MTLTFFLDRHQQQFNQKSEMKGHDQSDRLFYLAAEIHQQQQQKGSVHDDTYIHIERDKERKGERTNNEGRGKQNLHICICQ